MIKVGVVGGTGYTGAELLRLLASHRSVELHIITSRSEAGRPVGELFPGLRGVVNLNYSQPDAEALSGCDVVFFATPNGIAMKEAPAIVKAGGRMIDLAADFRIKDVVEWAHWYGQEHASPDLVDQAVYGLPELNREQIPGAQLVANPGCYPTAVQLGFAPLLKEGQIKSQGLIADVKSGVSGAGRGAKVATLLCEASESFSAYSASGHRHLPEIEQGLRRMLPAGESLDLTFVPHLTPMTRGIHATLYADLVQDMSIEQIHHQYETFYQDEAFVDVLPLGQHPSTRSVSGSNICRIGVFRPQNRGKVVIASAIDNLIKGAAGQAVQNMNLMFGYAEGEGLEQTALIP